MNFSFTKYQTLVYHSMTYIFFHVILNPIQILFNHLHFPFNFIIYCFLLYLFCLNNFNFDLDMVFPALFIFLVHILHHFITLLFPQIPQFFIPYSFSLSSNYLTFSRIFHLSQNILLSNYLTPYLYSLVFRNQSLTF